jgi:hypothetical protein
MPITAAVAAATSRKCRLVNMGEMLRPWDGRRRLAPICVVFAKMTDDGMKAK